MSVYIQIAHVDIHVQKGAVSVAQSVVTQCNNAVLGSIPSCRWLPIPHAASASDAASCPYFLN